MTNWLAQFREALFKPRVVEPPVHYDRCEKCGKIGVDPAYGAMCMPFRVQWCRGCAMHLGVEKLHRTCPKCGHVVIVDLANPGDRWKR